MLIYSIEKLIHYKKEMKMIIIKIFHRVLLKDIISSFSN